MTYRTSSPCPEQLLKAHDAMKTKCIKAGLGCSCLVSVPGIQMWYNDGYGESLTGGHEFQGDETAHFSITWEQEYSSDGQVSRLYYLHFFSIFDSLFPYLIVVYSFWAPRIYPKYVCVWHSSIYPQLTRHQCLHCSHIWLWQECHHIQAPWCPQLGL